MQLPTSTRRQLASLALAFAILLTSLAVLRAQQAPSDERTTAISLLEKGDTVAAAKLLKSATKKDKYDILAWYWLGRALEQQGKVGDARKSYEKAAKLGDAFLTKQLETVEFRNWASAINGLKPQLEIAVTSAEAFRKLSPKLSRAKAEEWNERVDWLRDFRYFSDGATVNLSIFRSSEVTTRARVLSKPEPLYTEAAREHKINGTVVLRAIFAEDGRVRAIFPIRRLPEGLTGAAIRAARQIRFAPAMKDGKPVSMWMQLEYNFNIY